MVTHILLWNYQEAVSAADRAALEADLVGLSEHIAELASLSFGPVFRWRTREYSHACVMTFADVAALDAYQAHPVHKAVGARLRAATSELVAIDYES